MTSRSAFAEGDPRRLLSATRSLTNRVRRAQRATWLPLLVFATVTFVSILVTAYGGHHPWTCATMPGHPGGRVCSVYSTAQFVYWPIALVLAYAAIAAFYIRRSNARGVGTRVRPYAVAGAIIAVAVTAVAAWGSYKLLVTPDPAALTSMPLRLVTPAGAIGLALLVLTWAERNRALLLLSVAYLAVVLLPLNFWVLGPNPNWVVPIAIHGMVLLLGGTGFLLAQRPWRRPA